MSRKRQSRMADSNSNSRIKIRPHLRSSCIRYAPCPFAVCHRSRFTIHDLRPLPIHGSPALPSALTHIVKLMNSDEITSTPTDTGYESDVTMELYLIT